MLGNHAITKHTKLSRAVGLLYLKIFTCARPIVNPLARVTLPFANRALESVEEFGTNHGPHAAFVPSGAAGRPKFDFPKEQLQYLIDYETSITKITQALGVSNSTIKQRVREEDYSRVVFKRQQ